MGIKNYFKKFILFIVDIVVEDLNKRATVMYELRKENNKILQSKLDKVAYERK